MRIEVDTARAGDLGVSVADVSKALQSLLGSRRVSTYVDRGEEYRVVVQAEEASRATETDLARIYVRSRTGTLVPLSNLVRARDMAGARDLGRYNKLRAITLQGGLAPGYSLGEALAFLEQQAAAAPEVAAVGYRGESQAFREAGGSIYLVFALTILVVYLLLAAQFESFVHPGGDHHHRAAGGGGRADRAGADGPDDEPLSARSASSCWSASPPRTAS